MICAGAGIGPTEKVWVGGEGVQVASAPSAQVTPCFDFEGGAVANVGVLFCKAFKFYMEDKR